MAKVNQKQVKEYLEEWAKVQAKITKEENTRNKKLHPFQVQYTEDTKHILEDFDKKTSPLREKSAEIFAGIKVLLESDRDADGNPKQNIIISENALVKVERKDGSRIINARKFFDFVKDKNDKFWNCFTVLIKEAKNVVSEKEIDDLSTKKTTFDVSISLKK